MATKKNDTLKVKPTSKEFDEFDRVKLDPTKVLADNPEIDLEAVELEDLKRKRLGSSDQAEIKALDKKIKQLEKKLKKSTRK